MGEYPSYYHESQVESMMDEWAKVSGIHWFEIAKGQLPPVVFNYENFDGSENVLVYREGLPVEQCKAIYHKDGKFFKWGKPNGESLWWRPTHFVFINLPQTEKV